jgi:hypothetical protein
MTKAKAKKNDNTIVNQVAEQSIKHAESFKDIESVKTEKVYANMNKIKEIEVTKYKNGIVKRRLKNTIKQA